MSDLKLWKFRYSCRAGTLEGLFVATQKEIDKASKRTVYYGEVLGKHSDVELDLKPSYFTEQKVDPEALEKITASLGKTWSGRNPLEKIAEDDDEEEAEADAEAEEEDESEA